MPISPWILSGRDTDPYPPATTSAGMYATAAAPGTFRLIPSNPRRIAFICTKMALSGPFYIRPGIAPALGGFVIDGTQPNLYLSVDTIGPVVKQSWWVQATGSINLYFYEYVEDAEG